MACQGVRRTAEGAGRRPACMPQYVPAPKASSAQADTGTAARVWLPRSGPRAASAAPPAEPITASRALRLLTVRAVGINPSSAHASPKPVPVTRCAVQGGGP